MLTKQKAKLIRQLHEKKHRQDLGLFLVEGEKSVAELLAANFTIDSLFITQAFFNTYKSLIPEKLEYTVVEADEIKNISSLEHNDTALAVVKTKKNLPLTIDPDEIAIVLDDIRDPGNLGTIMRIADWYGIKKIIASYETTDRHNPKTIAASMGSFTRIQTFYTDLKEFLSQQKMPIIGSFLEGEDIHSASLPPQGLLILGSEANGISERLLPFITKEITIPSYGKAESLNVAIAAGIIIDNWKRSLT